MLKKHALHLVRRERDKSRCDPAALAAAVAKDPSIPNDPAMSKDNLAQRLGEDGVWVDVMHIHPLDEVEDGPRHEEIARLVVGYGRESLKQDPICFCTYEDGAVEKASVDLAVIEAAHKASLVAQERARAFRAQAEIDAHKQAIKDAEAVIAQAAEMKALREAKVAEAARAKAAEEALAKR